MPGEGAEGGQITKSNFTGKLAPGETYVAPDAGRKLNRAFGRAEQSLNQQTKTAAETVVTPKATEADLAAIRDAISKTPESSNK